MNKSKSKCKRKIKKIIRKLFVIGFYPKLITFIGYSGMGFIMLCLGTFYSLSKMPAINDKLLDIFSMCLRYFVWMVPFIFSIAIYVLAFFPIRHIVSLMDMEVNPRITLSDEEWESKGKIRCKKYEKHILFLFIVEVLLILISALIIRFKCLEFIVLLFLQFFSHVVTFVFYILVLKNQWYESCRRMSFNVFWPSFMTIGLCFYYGLLLPWMTEGQIKSKCELMIQFIPVIFYIFFFMITAACEYMLMKKSYKRTDKRDMEAMEKRRIISMKRVALCGGFLVLLSAIGYLWIRYDILHNAPDTLLKMKRQMFRYLWFSIAMSLYFLVFESWDAISKYNNEKLLMRNIRHIDCAMLVYPVSFFTICSVFESYFINPILIFGFTIHTLMAIRGWINGNTDRLICDKNGRRRYNKYGDCNWDKKKRFYGVLAVVVLLLSMILPFFIEETDKKNIKVASNAVSDTFAAEIPIETDTTLYEYNDEHEQNYSYVEIGIAVLLGIASFVEKPRPANPLEKTNYRKYARTNYRGARAKMFSYAMILYIPIMVAVSIFAKSYFMVRFDYRTHCIASTIILQMYFFLRSQISRANNSVSM